MLQMDHLRSGGIPLVVVDPVNPPPPDMPSVGATNWAGGLAATEHLLGPPRLTAACGNCRIRKPGENGGRRLVCPKCLRSTAPAEAGPRCHRRSV